MLPAGFYLAQPSKPACRAHQKVFANPPLDHSCFSFIPILVLPSRFTRAIHLPEPTRHNTIGGANTYINCSEIVPQKFTCRFIPGLQS